MVTTHWFIFLAEDLQVLLVFLLLHKIGKAFTKIWVYAIAGYIFSFEPKVGVNTQEKGIEPSKKKDIEVRR